ncbi:MAG: hypothetical protein PF904_03790 [Kiritimatiellae bacterium]|nr:hypothetical protein [Kiritimatiellia bacterium]
MLRRVYYFVVLVIVIAFQCRLEGAVPEYVSTWDDLDYIVEEAYASATNYAVTFPPGGGFRFGMKVPYYVLTPGSVLESSTNLYIAGSNVGIQSWNIRITETQLIDRVWLYEGSSGVYFRTNSVPVDFDPDQWSEDAYGEPPYWFTETEMGDWYADRERWRLNYSVSLITSNGWASREEILRTASSNTVASGSSLPVLPANTNAMGFAGIEVSYSGPPTLWLYSPTNPVPIDIFSSPSLTPASGLWSLVGMLDGEITFESWEPYSSQSTAFYRATRGDIDSDGDGIADGRELLALGTLPDEEDSDGDGLDDRSEIYQYSTDPNLRDNDGDQIWDGWEVANGFNPSDPSDGNDDPDNDNLSNLGEFTAGTDPRDSDSDDDFMPDGWEVTNNLNPLDLLDAIADPDHDMLPNSYEYAYNLNPGIQDSDQVVKLKVNPLVAITNTNYYGSIAEALSASVPYSVVELAEGLYAGMNNVGIFMPTNPVMLVSDNWGMSRVTTIEYDGDNLGALNFAHNQDNRTIIRGITLRLIEHESYQVGFFVEDGGLVTSGGGASPVFDGVTVELGHSDVNIAFLCRDTASQPVIFNNCVIRGQPGENCNYRGIYAIDSPDMVIHNCSFLNFYADPYTYGVHLESTPSNIGLANDPVLVDFTGCAWDKTFTNYYNTVPFVRLENSVVYDVSMSACIVPSELEWFPPDTQSNVIITNAFLSRGGHQIPLSPGIDAGLESLTWYDFEGHPRDAYPDIGADEYAGFFLGDSDGDGISDTNEVTIYYSDPYDSDTDNDTIDDGAEVAAGSSCIDSGSYRVTIYGTVDNQSGTIAPVYTCYSGSTNWKLSTEISVAADGTFTMDLLAEGGIVASYINVFCDINTNGVVDALIEPIYSQKVVINGEMLNVDFLLKDFDGDGVPDYPEVTVNTSPMNCADYKITIVGLITNETAFAEMNLMVGYGFYQDGQSLIEVTNITQNTLYAFSNQQINVAGPLWAHLFDDIDTNSMIDADEIYISKQINVTNLNVTTDISISVETCDNDDDHMLDFWEEHIGLSSTNKADALENSDNDLLYNLHEYWLLSDPWSTTTNENYAIFDAINAVDEKIAALNPTTSLEIFSVQDHSNTNYVRNTNCWAYAYDLTCCSPWNSYSANLRAGTLISPRHVLFAAHYDQIQVNRMLRFVDNNNNVIERRLISKKRHVDFNTSTTYPDLTVGLLDSDVPTNQISFAKVLPDNYADYIYNGERLPVIRLDQEEKALVGDLRTITRASGSLKTVCYWMLENQDRKNFYESVILGDSGNPAFLIMQNQPVLLTVWSFGLGGSGTSVSAFKGDIEQMMEDLGGGYQLTEIDLSIFSKLND